MSRPTHDPSTWSLDIIKRVVRSYLSFEDEAIIEDVADEVWIKCASNTYRHWIPNRQIIRNVCYDWLRHKRIEDLNLESYGHATKRNKPELSTTLDVAALIDSSGLTSDERKIIWLRFWRGLGVNDIAVVNQTSPKLASDTLASAIVKLNLRARN